MVVLCVKDINSKECFTSIQEFRRIVEVLFEETDAEYRPFLLREVQLVRKKSPWGAKVTDGWSLEKEIIGTSGDNLGLEERTIEKAANCESLRLFRMARLAAAEGWSSSTSTNSGNCRHKPSVSAPVVRPPSSGRCVPAAPVVSNDTIPQQASSSHGNVAKVPKGNVKRLKGRSKRAALKARVTPDMEATVELTDAAEATLNINLPTINGYGDIRKSLAEISGSFESANERALVCLSVGVAALAGLAAHKLQIPTDCSKLRHLADFIRYGGGSASLERVVRHKMMPEEVIPSMINKASWESSGSCKQHAVIRITQDIQDTEVDVRAISFVTQRRGGARLHDDLPWLLTIYIHGGNNTDKILASPGCSAEVKTKLAELKARYRLLSPGVQMKSTDLNLYRISLAFPKYTLLAAKRHILAVEPDLTKTQIVEKFLSLNVFGNFTRGLDGPLGVLHDAWLWTRHVLSLKGRGIAKTKLSRMAHWGPTARLVVTLDAFQFNGLISGERSAELKSLLTEEVRRRAQLWRKSLQ